VITAPSPILSVLRRPALRPRARALALGWAGMLLAAGAQAQVLTFRADGLAPELQCPRAAAAGAATARPGPAAPAPRSPDAERPPDLDEVQEALAADGLPPGPPTDALPLTTPALPLRVALWGDSHAAANFFSETLAESLGFAGERVAPGFVPASAGMPGVRLPVGRACVGGQWTRSTAHRAAEGDARFPRSLVTAQTDRSGSYYWIDFRRSGTGPALRALDVYYTLPDARRRAVLGVAVDGGPETIVALDTGGDGVLQLRPCEALSTLKLRLIVGAVTLEGFAPQYLASPALVLDTFAVPGATARGWRVADAQYVQQRGGDAGYDLVLLEYGTNEGNDPKFDRTAYANELRASLRNVRGAYPQAACMLIGPTDRGVLVARRAAKTSRQGASPKVDLLRYSRVHQAIAETQQSVGREFGCKFWNWQTAMGGPGGAYRWFHQDPRLMAPDLIHLTPLGYQASARKFASALKLTPSGVALR
jgi:lysophospholipase L1-like esterase